MRIFCVKILKRVVLKLNENKVGDKRDLQKEHLLNSRGEIKIYIMSVFVHIF